MARTRPRVKRYRRKLAARKPCVHGESGLVLRPYQVLLHPLVSEKGTHQIERYQSYCFVVNPIATKTQIKEAVEEMFDVRVDKVRTQNYKGKMTRFRMHVGKQPDWKKAIVTLHGDDKIEIY